MERVKFSAVIRDASEDPEALRAESKIPAVIYGGDRDGATSLTVDRSAFLKLKKVGTSSTVIDLDIDGEETPVLLGEIQYHPVTDEVIHVDFRAVKVGVPAKAVIPLSFVGVPPAVKLGGLLIKNRNEVRVTAKPEALVPYIEVNLEQLATFEDAIHLEDLDIPEGVELMEDGRISVVAARPPKKVVEVAEVAQEGEEGGGEATEGEVAGEKKDGDSSDEGGDKE